MSASIIVEFMKTHRRLNLKFDVIARVIISNHTIITVCALVFFLLLNKNWTGLVVLSVDLTRYHLKENHRAQNIYQFLLTLLLKTIMFTCKACFNAVELVLLDGKIFGSRSGRSDRARGPCVLTESQIFPVRSDLTQSISILSYDHFFFLIFVLFGGKRTRAWHH